MCTELVLALIYFFTILIVNFLLFRLLNNYIKNIYSRRNLTTILIRFAE